MGVHLALVSHDEVFNNLSSPPVIVNNVDLNTQEDVERLNSQLMTKYDGDSLDVLPSCDCGWLKGERFVGIRCTGDPSNPHDNGCNTICVSVTERPLESLLWIAAPKGVAALVNPVAWVILSKKLTFDGVNLLEWLCNPYYKVEKNPPPQCLVKARKLFPERGLNYFYNNFDKVMETLFTNRLVQGSVKEKKNLQEYIELNRDRIFSQYIPIPSKLAFITESTATGTYADTSMKPAIDAVRTMSSIENSHTPMNLKERQQRTVQALGMLGTYYKSFFGKQLGGKPGWFRKHVFGSRLHFSFRAVISSISDNHQYDELHLPWSMSVMLFKVHLTAKLMQRGFTPNECIKFLYEHTNKYSPLLDELFCELIAEAPDGGIRVLFQRNPSLTRLSAQLLRVTRVKTDVNIKTISLSVLVLSGLNADFDGDALNGIIILDRKTLKSMLRLEPHLGVLDLRKPRSISKFIGIPAPAITTIANWLHRGK